ncbi:VOC family protein [Paenibacillus aurantiacus]|uniref:VOC family protein n=1 Tax=Paenibacillus aurantiacus TaxID=1936118 RepID=A0ABV5KX85_9BACL
MSMPSEKEGLPGSYRPRLLPRALTMIQGGRVMADNGVEQGAASASPVRNKVGGIFIPVRDIERARSWYCQVLGLNEADCPVHFGHLCPLPMEGTGIVLDTMPRWGGSDPGGAPPIATPAFMLLTGDLEGSLQFLREIGADLVTGIEHDHWFVVKDPDGNLLMVCRE